MESVIHAHKSTAIFRPIIENEKSKMMYRKYFKRMFDLIFATSALAAMLPLLIVVTVWLTIANKGGGAFFTQPRPGMGGKIFNIIKFKSMTDETDHDGNLLPDGKRLTKSGSIIRATSIDELPQLINILKGEMSFIGPRPLLVEYLPLYSAEQARRHEVRPELTGWAQCHGRNKLTHTERFSLDVWYVDHCNILTDMRIIWFSLMKVISCEGISSPTSSTMEQFTGNN